MKVELTVAQENICPFCGNQNTSRRSNAVYCSDICSEIVGYAQDQYRKKKGAPGNVTDMGDRTDLEVARMFLNNYARMRAFQEELENRGIHKPKIYEIYFKGEDIE